jgi:hypothetical protein
LQCEPRLGGGCRKEKRPGKLHPQQEEQPTRGLEHLHPKQGVRELHHGHYKFLTWFRVSHCMTQVRDYEPLHDVRVGCSLTRGVGLRDKRSLEI